MISMRLKNGHIYTLTDEGDVVDRTDVDAGGRPPRWPYSAWKILGFLRRAHSAQMVPLAEALAGADVGHGFVVDLDHGHTRVWAHPSNRRLARLEAS